MNMQARWHHELRDLVRSEQFMNWYRQYNILRESSKINAVRLGELRNQASILALKAEATQHNADDCVYRAGEYEDLAFTAQADFAEIENTSFEQLSQFETERRRATDTWQQSDSADKQVEDLRQSLSDLRVRADAARRVATPEGLAEAERIEARSREQATSLERSLREANEARQRLQGMQKTKDRLWGGVEESWSRAFRANMARSEYMFLARRACSDAEEQFARANAERRAIDHLMEEAKAAEQQVLALKLEYRAHLEHGREQFSCAIIDEFMYWPQQEKVSGAWTVPLVDERRHLNLQVSALQLYQLERGTGLDAVEPWASEAEGSAPDARLDAFFNAPAQPRAHG